MIATLTALLIPILSWTLLGLVLERFFPAEKQQPWRHIVFNLMYLPLYLASFAFLAPIIASTLPAHDFTLFRLELGATLLGSVFQILLVFFLADFFYYLWHRAQHTWQPLWRIHELHHTERSLNVTTASRHHWLEETLRPLVVAFPLGLILQIEPSKFLFVGFAMSAWPYFIHSNLRLNLGKLSHVLVGPQYHRVHHSIEPQHWNRNFAAFSPLWDYLFGTVYIPRRDEFPATGLTDRDGEAKTSAATALNIPFADFGKTRRSE